MLRLGPGFILLWQGQVLSQIGNQAVNIVVMFWTLETTGSATIMSLLTATSLVSSIIFGPIAGAFTDKLSRTGMLIASDGMRALTMAGLAAAILWLPPAQVLPLMFLAMVVNGLGASFVEPAMSAVMAQLLGTGKLNAGNSLWQVTRQMSAIAGQVLGGGAFRWLGAPLLLAVNTAMFSYAALSSTAAARLQTMAAPSAAVATANIWSIIREGLEYTRTRRGLLPFLLGVSVFNALIAPVVVLLPMYVTTWLGQEANWYGFLMASLSAGAVCGSLLAARNRSTSTRRAWLLITLFAGVGACLLGIAALRNRWLVAGVLALAGGMAGAVNVIVSTLLQVSTPDAYRGRVVSLHATLSRALGPLGVVAGGILGDLTNGHVPIVYAASGSAAMLVAACFAASRMTREFLGSDA